MEIVTWNIPLSNGKTENSLLGVWFWGSVSHFRSRPFVTGSYTHTHTQLSHTLITQIRKMEQNLYYNCDNCQQAALNFANYSTKFHSSATVFTVNCTSLKCIYCFSLKNPVSILWNTITTTSSQLIRQQKQIYFRLHVIRPKLGILSDSTCTVVDNKADYMRAKGELLPVSLL